MKTYAENSRETIRKKALRPFRDEYAIIQDNGLATNSGKYKYRLVPEVLDLIQTYQTPEWSTALKYWEPKIYRNNERDQSNKEQLQALGWKVLTVWECELKKPAFEKTMENLINSILDENIL